MREEPESGKKKLTIWFCYFSNVGCGGNTHPLNLIMLYYIFIIQENFHFFSYKTAQMSKL